MNSYIRVLVCLLLLSTKSPAQDKLAQGFVQVPDSIQTSVYWYWISDNISSEGVIKDLEAMKRAGINRAFIANIGMDVPYGKVKLFSETWWNAMHTALKTATKLGIEIGIFNSPGWSQSGGPWVKPAQSMRYLTATEVAIEGPLLTDVKLIKPADDFQDVKVIAYRAPKGYELNPLVKSLKVSSDTASLNFKIATDFSLRSVQIYPDNQQLLAQAALQVKVNGNYQTIKTFTLDRHNKELNVGFLPYGPIAVAVPQTKAQDFRLLFTGAKYGLSLRVALAETPIVESYIEKTLAKMYQDPLPYWTAYQWPKQADIEADEMAIDPKTVVDITKYMQPDGTLKWNAPAGKWIIQRLGMLPTAVTNSPATPEGTGLETDKMSKPHIVAHFDAFLGELIKRIPAADRKSWKLVVQDSYETGGQNWTDDMRERFMEKYRYDPLPYLPAMQGRVVGDAEQSDRFLWDLRRLIADRVAYDYVGGLREVSHQYGLKTWLEGYGHWGFPGEFLQYGGQSDEVGGEFWSEGELGDIENRAASSTAHIYGKNKVSAESFTAAGKTFGRFPYMMKQRGDRFFTEGINNSLLHLFIHQPDERVPGVNAWFGNEFNRHNTWFPYLDLFTIYLKRCNYLLQQGNYVADVAYFIGEDAPKMTGITSPALPKGYSFDYINAEVLLKRAKVVNNRLVLPGGMSYGLLVLPPLTTMRPELLQKISDLVAQGLHILGPAPDRSPSLANYPNADIEVKKLAAKLWSDSKVHTGNEIGQVLASLKIKPDFVQQGKESLLFIHRSLPDREIYFVSNQQEQTVNVKPSFNVYNMAPEVWDPISGMIRKLPTYNHHENGIQVPLQLAPLQSLFIVFKKAERKVVVSTKPNFPIAATVAEIKGPWQVTFNTGLGKSSWSKQFEVLTDWTLHQDENIKYYSGTAVYQNTFMLTEAQMKTDYYLTVDALNGMAKVKINGIEVGGIWTAPWHVAITKAIKKGENKVEIAIVNNWMNRLIGDSKLPTPQRTTHTFVNPYTPKSILQPSGLTGVVKIQKVQY
jgi:hypothetical protein